jgi:IS30 family transposase
LQMSEYKRLSMKDREEISRGLASRMSSSKIGLKLGRKCSTITREIRRNSLNKLDYRAIDAQQKAQAAAKTHGHERKLVSNKKLERMVVKCLKRHWSPEQIENRLKILYPKDTKMRITHEPIYAYIYLHPRHHLKRELLKYLRRKHIYRRENKPKAKSCPIQDYISIEERPQVVEGRKIAGHWEGDLLMGSKNETAAGALIKRTSRLTLITKLKDKDTRSVCMAFARKFNRLPKALRKSMTYDHGSEMADHAELARSTKIKVYFAHPHSPWERGTSENTNSLIREFFPKGTDFSKVTTAQLKKVENLLNDRPRKVLNWQTPREVFTKLVALGIRN